MATLPLKKRLMTLNLLLEGNSIRGTARLMSISPVTVLKLVRDTGSKCVRLENKLYRDISAPTIQCDEMWSFVYGKARNLYPPLIGQGDAWIWIALDKDTRFILNWHIGSRSNNDGDEFLAKLATRVTNVLEVCTDGHIAYLSTPFYFGPDVAHVVGHTEYVERHNLNMRTYMKRLHRKTNGFSKSWDHHYFALAMYIMWYNSVVSIGRWIGLPLWLLVSHVSLGS